MEPSHEPIPTPWPQRVEDFKRQRLPLIVWSLAGIACVFMLAQRVGRFEHIGVAQAVQYEVSAPITGRLSSVVVELYDSVEAGDVVAVMDDSALAAEVDTASALVRQLGAELEAARTEYMERHSQNRANWVADLRRFQADEEERRLAALELKGTLEADGIELERMELQLRRSLPLLDRGLIGQEEYDDIRLQRDALRRRAEENRLLLAQTENERVTAQLRREEFERRLPAVAEEEAVLLPLREAIAVETRRLREIEARRAGAVLRSPVDGQVSQVLCRAGQAVVPGEPILVITEPSVQEIVAWLRQDERRVVRPNDMVLVSSMARPGVSAESVVLRVGTSLDPLPPRLWREPAIADFGRAVVIAPTPGLELTPGELLHVRFLSSR